MPRAPQPGSGRESHCPSGRELAPKLAPQNPMGVACHSMLAPGQCGSSLPAELLAAGCSQGIVRASCAPFLLPALLPCCPAAPTNTHRGNLMTEKASILGREGALHHRHTRGSTHQQHNSALCAVLLRTLMQPRCPTRCSPTASLRLVACHVGRLDTSIIAQLRSVCASQQAAFLAEPRREHRCKPPSWCAPLVCHQLMRPSCLLLLPAVPPPAAVLFRCLLLLPLHAAAANALQPARQAGRPRRLAPAIGVRPTFPRSAAPDPGELGVPAADQGLGPVEDHGVPGLAGLLPLALLHGLGGLSGLGLALVLSCVMRRRCSIPGSSGAPKVMPLAGRHAGNAGRRALYSAGVDVRHDALTTPLQSPKAACGSAGAPLHGKSGCGAPAGAIFSHWLPSTTWKEGEGLETLTKLGARGAMLDPRPPTRNALKCISACFLAIAGVNCAQGHCLATFTLSFSRVGVESLCRRTRVMSIRRGGVQAQELLRHNHTEHTY